MDTFRDFVRTFSSSWFALVMGTGVFTTSTHMIGAKYSLSFLMDFASVMAFLNFVFFFIILVPFVGKLVFFWKEVKEDFKNPIKANFYVT